jgi:hypothetical protein
MKNALIEAIYKNRIRLSEIIGEAANASITDHGTFKETRIDTCLWGNTLFDFSLSEDRLSDEIESIKSNIKNGILPNLLEITPSPSSMSIIRKLSEAGFLQKPAKTGMYLPKDLYIPPRASDSYMHIEIVSSETAMGKWVQTVTSFLLRKGKEEAKQMLSLCRNLIRMKHCSFFLGQIDSLPVSTAFLLSIDRIGGLYFIVTHPDYRKRGYGSLITAAAIKCGISNGLLGFILHATDSGLPIYRKLGFVESDPVRTFYLP